MEKSGEEGTTSVVLMDRASRATRGKRLTKLLDDDLEQDELFWSQDALKEDAEDDNYQEEPEIADEFDSDFDEDVSLSQSHSQRSQQLIKLTLPLPLALVRSLNLTMNNLKTTPKKGRIKRSD